MKARSSLGHCQRGFSSPFFVVLTIVSLATTAGPAYGLPLPQPPLPDAATTAKLNASKPAPAVYQKASVSAATGTQPAAAIGSNTYGTLSYYGGPVLTHPFIIQLLWNNNVDARTQNEMVRFYEMLSVSEWMNWLSEYSTTYNAYEGSPLLANAGSHFGQVDSNQAVGLGAAAGWWVMNQTATNVTDYQIQTALIANIDSGNIPAPSDGGPSYPDVIYMIHATHRYYWSPRADVLYAGWKRIWRIP
jgi:hypothetical protein